MSIMIAASAIPIMLGEALNDMDWIVVQEKQSLEIRDGKKNDSRMPRPSRP
jgi:hypothetical protein